MDDSQKYDRLALQKYIATKNRLAMMATMKKVRTEL